MFDPADMLLWVLATARASGLMLMLPIFMVRSIPGIMRVAIASMFGWLAMPYVAAGLAFPPELLEFVLLLAKELSIGLLMGLAVRLVFFAIDAATQILAVEIGLNPSPEFDPGGRSHEGNPLGTALFYLGVVIFMSGAHYAVLFAFIRSFELVPPGLQAVSADFVPLLVRQTGYVLQLGVLMAAPVMAMNFLVNLAFSLLGRVVPRMNVFVLSFSLRIAAGFGLLIATVGLLAHYILRQLGASPELMLHFIPFRAV